MTLEDAFEGLNREQRRRLQKLTKKGIGIKEARDIVLLTDDTKNNTNGFGNNKSGHNGPRNRTTFIRKSS